MKMYLHTVDIATRYLFNLNVPIADDCPSSYSRFIFEGQVFGLIYLRENNNASPNAVYNHGSIKRGGRGEYI